MWNIGDYVDLRSLDGQQEVIGIITETDLDGVWIEIDGIRYRVDELREKQTSKRHHNDYRNKIVD